MFLEAHLSTRQMADELTIDSLRDEHLEAVFAYASRRLSKEDAEDATAETFQAAIDYFGKMRGANPRLWLLGIARRKVADILRRRSRRREVPISDFLPVSPGKSLEQAEADREVRRIVMSLPDNEREVLLLQNLEELSVAEIAVVMGKTPSAVSSLLHRARTRAFKQGQAYFLDLEEKR